MRERFGEEMPQPLPRGWLPEAAPPDGDPQWEVRAQRIVAAAEPSLRRLGEQSAADITWSTWLGSWWKPAAVMATTAAALLILLDPIGRLERFGEGSLPLNVMAAEGEPFALWNAAGIDADPVLALIAMQEPAR